MEHDQSDKLLSEYDRLSADFARLGGYDMDTDRNRVANGLDIPQSMREQPFDLLSGGERTRVNLARLILEKRTYFCSTSRQTTLIFERPNGLRTIFSILKEPFCL